MEKQEVLVCMQNKKVTSRGEDSLKVDKSCLIATIVACSLAIVLMIIEGIMGNYTSLYALGSVCFIWTGVYQFCRYFLRNRNITLLITGVLFALGAIAMILLYILFSAGIL